MFGKVQAVLRIDCAETNGANGWKKLKEAVSLAPESSLRARFVNISFEDKVLNFVKNYVKVYLIMLYGHWLYLSVAYQNQSVKP